MAVHQVCARALVAGTHAVRFVLAESAKLRAATGHGMDVPFLACAFPCYLKRRAACVAPYARSATKASHSNKIQNTYSREYWHKSTTMRVV